jgi:hypothetical protein
MSCSTSLLRLSHGDRKQLLSIVRSLSGRKQSFGTRHVYSSSRYMDPNHSQDPAVSTTPSDLTPGQRVMLDSALRVDQAGEVAANWIYKGQMLVLGRDPATASLIQVMRFLFVTVFRQIQRIQFSGNVGSGEETSRCYG